MTTAARRSRRPLGSLYYGWTLIGTLSLTELVSWGVLYYAFTVFITPMHRDLGWSRGALTGAFSLALLVQGISGLAAGRWLDARGPRLLMTCGSCAAVVLVLCWSAVGSLWLFYLTWAAIGVVLAAVLYDPAFWVVATWFSRYRSRALTLLTFVAGFASVIFIPLAQVLVARQGWRAALVTLALILAATTILPHALLLRRRPEDAGLVPDGTPAMSIAGAPRESGVRPRAALRSAAFWWLTAAFVLHAVGSITVFVHLVPFLTDRGDGAGFAAGAASLVGIMALPGRLLFTPLGERVSRALLTTLLFLLQALGLAVLVAFPGRTGVVAFVVLFGMGYGAVTPARAALVADYYGRAYYGSIAAALGLFVVGGRAIAPVAVGIVRDRTGQYATAFWVMAALSLAAAAAVYVAERLAARAAAAALYPPAPFPLPGGKGELP
jgi:MFS family permease